MHGPLSKIGLKIEAAIGEYDEILTMVKKCLSVFWFSKGERGRQKRWEDKMTLKVMGWNRIEKNSGVSGPI